jgi:hypothetical protein
MLISQTNMPFVGLNISYYTLNIEEITTLLFKCQYEKIFENIYLIGLYFADLVIRNTIMQMDLKLLYLQILGKFTH